MKKLLYGIIILLVFTSCNQEVKKQSSASEAARKQYALFLADEARKERASLQEDKSFTIDYLKSNKWCTMNDGNQWCLKFSDNKMIGFVDGKQEGSDSVKLEQRSDSLIVFILNVFETEQEGFIRMKSLDTLRIQDANKQMLGDFARVQQNPPLRCGNTMEHNFPPKKK